MCNPCYRKQREEKDYCKKYYKKNANKFKAEALKHHYDNRDTSITKMKEWRLNANSKASKGVYIAFGKNGFYIGQSKRIELRIRHSHITNDPVKTPIQDFLGYKIIEYIDDRDKRLEREAYWINKLNPSLNTLR